MLVFVFNPLIFFFSNWWVQAGVGNHMYYWWEITWDSFAAKSSTPRAHLGIGNDVRVIRRRMLPHTMGDVASKWIEAWHASRTNSQHAINGPNSVEVAIRWLHTIDTNTAILMVIKARLVCVVAPPLILSTHNPMLKVSSYPRYKQWGLSIWMF